VSLIEGEALGLTPVQVQTLLFCAHTRPELASVGHLARSLATTHATAVGVVDGLVRRGLLERRVKPEDRRVTLLSLTPEGVSVCDQLDRWNAALEDAIDRLTLDEQVSLERGLRVLSHDLAISGHLHMIEPCPGCVHFVENANPGALEPHYCQLFRRHMSETESQLECPKHTPGDGDRDDE
ncbi:MAG: MarR family transcriptional regulator, partial [Dehalococcoidia bacterium]|nr:MarR family transcriptional regulator [Dehalococcoidia bacterium]